MRKADSIFLQPGQVHVNPHPACISTVCAAGIVLCLWDRSKRWGGACHFVVGKHPSRAPATLHFGAIAIATMLRMLRDIGSLVADLDAKVFGGAAPPEGLRELAQISTDNVEFTRDQLARLRIPIRREDTGGHCGRKIVYYSESNLAKVLHAERIRQRDWYAPVDALRWRRGRVE